MMGLEHTLHCSRVFWGKKENSSAECHGSSVYHNILGKAWAASVGMRRTSMSEGITQAVGSKPMFYNTHCLPSTAFLSTSSRVMTQFSVKVQIVRTCGTNHSMYPPKAKAASECTHEKGL